MVKKIITSFLFLLLCNLAFAQAFSWSGYQNATPNSRGKTFTRDAYTYVVTTSGVTMNATISHNGGNAGSDVTNSSGSCSTGPTNQIGTTLEYFSAGTLDPCFYYSPPSYNSFAINGMWLGVDWPSASHDVTIDMTFSSPVANPNFIIADINQGANFSDKVVISAVNCAGTTIYPSSVTNLNSPFTYNSANGTIENTVSPTNSGAGLGTADLQTNIAFSAVVTSIKVVYKSNATPPAANPTYQYVLLGQINFTPNAGSTLTITPVISSCGASTATLTATSGFPTYTWSTVAPGSISSPNAVTTAISGYAVYTVSASVAAGCPPSTASYTFNAAAASALPPVGTLSGGSIFCAGGTTTVSTTATGVSYSWTGPGIVSGASSAIATVNATGAYNVTVTSNTNSCTNSGVVNVGLGSLPVVNITLTCGATACARYNFTSALVPATSGVTYQWQQSSDPSTANPPGNFTNIAGQTSANFNGGNGGLCGNPNVTGKWIRLVVTLPGCPPIYSSTAIFTQNTNPGCALVSVPLAVELSRFQGYCRNNEITIAWTTQTESNNDYFTIEKSKNGLDFIPKFYLAGAKHSNSPINYSKTFTEEDTEFKYYRLKQTDYSRENSYSKIIYISCEESRSRSGDITVFPNPANEKISVFMGEFTSSVFGFVITDVIGREIKRIEIKDSSMPNIDLPIDDLDDGIYFLRMLSSEGNDQESSVKFIKDSDK